MRISDWSSDVCSSDLVARQVMGERATTTMKQSKSGSKEEKEGASPSQLIDARIKELSDWRGETRARVRSLIKQADPEMVEEWKWRTETGSGGKDGVGTCSSRWSPIH